MDSKWPMINSTNSYNYSTVLVHEMCIKLKEYLIVSSSIFFSSLGTVNMFDVFFRFQKSFFLISKIQD